MKTPEEILGKYRITNMSKRTVVSCYKLVHYTDALKAMKTFAREACEEQNKEFKRILKFYLHEWDELGKPELKERFKYVLKTIKLPEGLE